MMVKQSNMMVGKLRMLVTISLLILTMIIVGSMTTLAYDLVYKHPDMSKVQSTTDIVYKVVDGEELKLDVYYPLGQKDGKNAHTVLLVHGGYNTTSVKDEPVFQSWGRLAAVKGFTAIAFNWRLHISSTDVTDLLNYLRANADELKINFESMTIFAFSAGVKEGVLQAVQANTGYIKSIVGYYGELDPALLKITPASKLPTMLMVMARWDYEIDPAINDQFIADAKALGHEIRSIVHPGGIHGFEIFNDNQTTYDIIDETFEFIKLNSGKQEN